MLANHSPHRSALAAAPLLLFAVLLASPPGVVADVTFYTMADYPASQGNYYLSPGVIAVDSSTGEMVNTTFTLAQYGGPIYSVYATALNFDFGRLLDIIPTAGGGTAIVVPPGEGMYISGQLNGGPDRCTIAWCNNDPNSSPASLLMAGYGPPPSYSGNNIYYCPPSPVDVSGLPVGGNWIIAKAGPSPKTWLGGNPSAPTDWNVAANWNPNKFVPNGSGTIVSFGNQPALNNVVDMISQGQTAGEINFAATTSTTIQSSGGFALILDNYGSASTIAVEGSHTISAPVILNNDATISGTGTLNLLGGISGSHNLEVDNNLTATSIQVDTLTIGSGDTVTIQPIPGGPLGNTIAPVPEPSTLVLLGAGAISLLVYTWRRRRGTA